MADITTKLVVEKRSFTEQTTYYNEANVNVDESTTQTTTAKNYYEPIRTLRWAGIGLTLHGPSSYSILW